VGSPRPAAAAGAFGRGIVDCIPTILGYLSIGFSAGALAHLSAGMSVAEIALMSLVLYAGSAQFVVAGMLSSGALAGAIVVSVFFVNLRHLLMSTWIAPHFRELGAVRSFAVGALLTDETFGVASTSAGGGNRLTFPWMMGLNIAAYVNWLAGNVLGALAAGFIPVAAAQSLSFALVAMFIGLVVIQISAAPRKGVQVCAALAAGLLVFPASALAGPEFSVVIAASVAALAAMLVLKWTSATR